MNKKWEYHIQYMTSEDAKGILSLLGNDKWELVHIDTTTKNWVTLLKREKDE
jgi:hypothetical protein